VLNLLHSLHTDHNSFLRSSCYSLWAALLPTGGLETAGLDQLEEQLTSCLLTDQEAIVRRAAVDLLAQLAGRPELVSPTRLQRLEVLMISVLSKDFDWELKVKSAHFWTEILQQQLLEHEQTSQRLLTTLEQHQLFTALHLGLLDYEISVKAAFKPIWMQLAKLNFKRALKPVLR
jgi:Domain of unknown function (DUF4042)